jgi:hypothetical protein
MGAEPRKTAKKMLIGQQSVAVLLPHEHWMNYDYELMR